VLHELGEAGQSSHRGTKATSRCCSNARRPLSRWR
jgi:hypothetical protein